MNCDKIINKFEFKLKEFIYNYQNDWERQFKINESMHKAFVEFSTSDNAKIFEVMNKMIKDHEILVNAHNNLVAQFNELKSKL